MKKVFTIFSSLFLSLALSAQVWTVTDTVSLGAGYSQQSWYKLSDGAETKGTYTNWDLAFSTQGRDAAIWTNHTTKLYRAVAPASAWATVAVDTALLTDDLLQYNSDTAWYYGALNQSGDNIFNYGWGNYSGTSRNVVGDSVYVLKTGAGTWKKLVIERLVADTVYNFKYANLDGSNPQTFELKKRFFVGKNFAYFSLINNNTLDREPLSNQWDLSFQTYYGLTPDNLGQLQTYLLRGVLSNKNLRVAKASGRDTSINTTAGLNFGTKINVIGADWKSFNGSWKVADTTAYFINTGNAIYKLVFTGFGGSGNGNIIFKKTLLTTVTSNAQDVSETKAVLSVYPNPASGDNINVVYDLGDKVQNADFQLFNLVGQVVYSQNIKNTSGLQNLNLPALNLTSGLYVARLTFAGRQLVQKIYIQ
jgi:hypothetical protein